MKSAIIRTGGKQYLVQPGAVISIEKIAGQAGDAVSFDQVLMTSEGSSVQVGTPVLSTVVTGEIIEQGKGEKIRVSTYKAKKRYRRTIGHRQQLTKVKITAIGQAAAKPAAAKAEKSTSSKAKKAPAAAK